MNTKGILKTLQKNFPNQNFTHTTVQFIATHTHSGPAGLAKNPFWAISICDSFNRSLYDVVSNQIISAVNQAMGNLTNIQTVDSAKTQLSGYNFTRFEGMPVDESTFYMNFKDVNTNSIGCFQIFSGHPTWYGIDNLVFSSDFGGYLLLCLDFKSIIQVAE